MSCTKCKAAPYEIGTLCLECARGDRPPPAAPKRKANTVALDEVWQRVELDAFRPDGFAEGFLRATGGNLDRRSRGTKTELKALRAFAEQVVHSFVLHVAVLSWNPPPGPVEGQ